MKMLNEEISRIKELINLNESSSKYSKVVDTYDNVDFKDGIVGNSRPSQDSINPALLKDIDVAAKNAGVKVSVTTAVSGHNSLPSRHPDGNAVDIAIINGKAVSKNNRDDADKFVNALVSMGYTKNKEIGSDKAVLTFGFPKHDDHVHVSNKTEISSSGGDIGNTSYYINFLQKLFKYIFSTLKEQYSNFGKNVAFHTKDILIPSKNNETIKSPVSGVIKNYSYNSGCKNQVSIMHQIDKQTFYLEYCGIKNVSVSKGENVSVGTVIGTTDSDVTVYFYNESGRKQYVEDMLNKKTSSTTASKRTSGERSPIETSVSSERNPIQNSTSSERNPIQTSVSSERSPIQKSISSERNPIQ